jgi:hypothetical protein
MATGEKLWPLVHYIVVKMICTLVSLTDLLYKLYSQSDDTRPELMDVEEQLCGHFRPAQVLACVPYTDGRLSSSQFLTLKLWRWEQTASRRDGARKERKRDVRTSNKVLTSQSQFWKKYSKGDPESALFPIPKKYSKGDHKSPLLSTASVAVDEKVLRWSDVVTGNR